ncbi:MAG: hypothetical protein KF752_01585 [Pirellulaceae bacterium]|nr:hypothetical protein [Pirellulaceae bacterium]
MSTVVLLLSKDVFFWPIVKNAAEQANLQTVVVTSATDTKLESLDAADVACCLIDIGAIEVTQLSTAIDQLRQRLGPVHMVAFGPHVQEARLQAAADAGCNSVLTRGQLSGKLHLLLPKWIS